ncbi:hypothetical protein DM02DRAFT_678480 [Periconia macrospinosa]|uniref:Uncharacterized protein n=1 Tax=Periconia macrospinosa TaxID=97972 RepID=A0A2V1CYT3_9PLEO|nr:hypothetical protein DM02DRAFT_678480 [Periconia macrospinosa]
MDAPSAQLQLEIRDSVVRLFATRRPLLHHLNADTSWLLQIPRPATAVKHGSRIYYNILIDPWFVGGQSDVARWFSQQFHAIESAVKSVAEVEELAREIEILAGGLRLEKGRRSNTDAGTDVETFIDAVVVSHEFTDHCHKETLLEVHPVFATEKAAGLISSFKHFRDVATTPTFTADAPDWRDYSLPPLPSWLSISRLTAAEDALYHSAILITFATHPFLPTTPKKRSSLLQIHPEEPSSDPDAAECVVYISHGIQHTALRPIEVADPPLHTLAFLHGLRDTAGEYWVATHDEVKKGGGLVAWFLQRKIWTLEDALKEARAELDGEDTIMGTDDYFENVRFEDVGNGESRVLE